MLLAPNEWLHASFGKYLFAACDIVAGVLMWRMLVSFVLPRALPVPKDEKGMADRKRQTSERATLLTATHLLNPLVFTISTRGSSESVLSLFVLLTLHFALTEEWDKAAVFLGLSTHWKIYPFVYGVACLGVIGNGYSDGWRRLVNARTVRFAMISASTFALLGVGMYLM